MTPTLHVFPAAARPVATWPAGVAALPQTGRAAVYTALVRALREEFGIEPAALAPSVTLAKLGLKPLQWWLVHEAVLETLPHLGTHPAFDDPAAVHRTLADLATWRLAPATQAASPKAAPVVGLHRASAALVD
jgi:hypothetical protein